MSRRLINIGVDPEFAKKFKIVADANGKSMAQLSRDLAEIDDGIMQLIRRLKL